MSLSDKAAQRGFAASSQAPGCILQYRTRALDHLIFRSLSLSIADWPKGRHLIVSLVEATLTADSLRPGPDEIRYVPAQVPVTQQAVSDTPRSSGGPGLQLDPEAFRRRLWSEKRQSANAELRTAVQKVKVEAT